MRNILAAIGALVVGFGGAGWYFGWYKLNVTKAPDGNPQITTTINTQKATEDVKTGTKRGWDLIEDQARKAAEENKGNATPAATPGPISTPQPADAPQSGGVFGPGFAVPQPETKPIQLVAPK